MASYSFSTSSSGKGVGSSGSATQRVGSPYLSECEIQAYLMARDALRRVKRTSWLLDSTSRKAEGRFNAAQASRQLSA